MELKIVRIKTFRKLFFNFFLISVLIIGGSFLLYKKRIDIFPGFSLGFGIKNALIYAFIAIALIFAYYVINRKQKIRKLLSFDEKIREFERLYTRRLWWHVLSSLSSAVFLLLSYHIIFFYFGLFDLLSLLSAYPSPEILKKELDAEDLIFN